MVQAFDPRLIRVSITVATGTYQFDESIAIYASGSKTVDAAMNPLQIRIFNLSSQLRNEILTQASPLRLQKIAPCIITLDVGRQSYGTFRLYEGDVISCDVTQPPDIGITLNSLTNNYFMSLISNASFPSPTRLSQISKKVADANNKQLVFEATDKQIDNFNHNGAINNQIGKLDQIGGTIAFVDNAQLVVIDSDKARKGEMRVISATSGMVGIPQVTVNGVLVRTMVDNSLKLGCEIQVISTVNPVANGNYFIRAIHFDIASRDEPFFYTLECVAPAYYIGGSIG